jgi:hypothetical protein
MSLVALPPEIFAQVLDLLLSAHQARLFKTGDLRMQRLLANTPRTCSLTLANRHGDSVAVNLLKTASDIRSDESLLFHVVNNDENRATMALKKIRSMEIMSSACAPPGERILSVNLASFERLETLVYPGGYFREQITLPVSITCVDISICNSDPIYDLGNLTSLTSLKLRLGHTCDEEELMSRISWPKSLSSLTLEFRRPKTMDKLYLLPASLTHLTLESTLDAVPFSGLPAHLVSLQSLKLMFRQTTLSPSLSLPPSLTSLYIDRVVPSASSSIAACLGSLPLHITDFSFSDLGWSPDIDSITVAYRTLLSRITTLASLERAICASFQQYNKARHSELTTLYIKSLARFGLDHRYLDLLIGAGSRNNSNRFKVLYDAKVPQSYIDAFMNGVHRSTVFAPVVATYGDEESMKFASWAFEFARAQRLELYNKSGTNESYAQPLPENVCNRVKFLHIDVVYTTPLSTLFSKPMPMLESIELSLTSSRPLDVIATALYSCRRNLPRLETLDHDTTSRFDDASISLLAEMRLYDLGRRADFSFAVSPPEHVLQKYPHLRPKPIKAE